MAFAALGIILPLLMGHRAPEEEGHEDDHPSHEREEHDRKIGIEFAAEHF